MRKILIIPFLFLISLVFAQKHEVGIFLGGANAIADIGSTNYINILPRKVDDKLKIPFVVGGVYRYNLNPQQGLRFNLSYASITDDNAQAIENYRKYRKDGSYATYKSDNYSNSIFEFSIVFEYNFFPINSEQQMAHSPYIFAGAGLFASQGLYYRVVKRENDENLVDELKKSRIDFSIPFGIGYKYKFNWNWVISAEVGFRPTFFDGLDLGTIKDVKYYKESDNKTVELREAKEVEKLKKWFEQEYKIRREVGDNSKNDWYVFTGITLSYSFGRLPCFCD